MKMSMVLVWYILVQEATKRVLKIIKVSFFVVVGEMAALVAPAEPTAEASARRQDAFRRKLAARLAELPTSEFSESEAEAWRRA